MVPNDSSRLLPWKEQSTSQVQACGVVLTSAKFRCISVQLLCLCQFFPTRSSVLFLSITVPLCDKTWPLGLNVKVLFFVLCSNN
jgi:hypothetical protein